MMSTALSQLLLTPEPLLCILVEVGARSGGSEVTRYLSNRGYVTDATQTPANVVYDPCIVGGVGVRENLPLDGSAAMSWGDVEIANPDGVRDSWLNDVWSGRAVTILAGDVSWPRSTFVTVFSGVMEDISTRSAETLNLLIRDKAQQINEAMSEATVGGTGPNKDELRPLCFGECHNVTPVLVDAVNLVYQVHNGPIEDIIEVRDNGVPVNVAKNLAAGTFALTASPVGTITASVQGAKPAGSYLTRVGDIITHIVTTYGKTPLLTTDIDTVQVDSFNAAHAQAVGVYLDGRANVLKTCQDLAASVGAQVTLGSGGKLQIKKVALPAAGTPEQVAPSDMLKGSLAVSATPKVQPAFRLAYCRNWTVLTGLQTGLPAEHSDMYGREWLVVQVKDQAVADEWKLSTSPEEEQTLLVSREQAEAEAQRRLNLWGVRRKVLRYEGHGPSLLRELGSAVTITHPRFDLSAGRTGQVISREVDWLAQRVTFEVLV